ncbi:NADH dehydrogenase (ubiquinone) 1 alpha subcomplex assembly factor 7 [Candidatus Xenohaliotis californiensis]|uniref:NADH dehydrogenase (Ubiquinone) 1 alpha subcomplex assembly factor 7 n=1 Tax=Candidatus Xenohaliotis californiensis TaxID=84677 RepID=A0ABP0EVK4_9RICK|nr:NADH dehydrogenase (ubiquinone) 1 alpha subcomplex assembly factor 7 [Candidatus Xenohaliotis californiensis]
MKNKTIVHNDIAVSPHVDGVSKFFIQIIKSTEPVSVADFMSMVLTHEEYGYYVNKKALGHDADFITAPHISQMFAEILAVFCVYSWELIGAVENVALVDLGSGGGALLRQLIKCIKAHSHNAYKALDILPVDINKMPLLLDGGSIVPIDLHSLPEKPSIIIANEFFDALPIYQLLLTGNGWREVAIMINQDKLCFTLVDPKPSILPYLSDVGNVPIDSIIEISPMSWSVMSYLATHVARYSGILIVIDYGYTKKRTVSSLHGVCKHKSVSILETPGEIDVSAYVDFNMLRKACREHNIYCQVFTQGNFLKSLGIMERLSNLCTDVSKEVAENLYNGVQTLVSSEHMGELFKVMLVSSFPLDLSCCPLN